MNVPYRSFSLVALMLAGFGAPGAGQAQVAGSTTFNAAVVDVQVVAMGWSAKKQILGASVYNDADELVGKIDDIIVAPDSSVSTAIVGVGGFIGVGRVRSRHPRVAFQAGQVPAPAGRDTRAHQVAAGVHAGGK